MFNKLNFAFAIAAAFSMTVGIADASVLGSAARSAKAVRYLQERQRAVAPFAHVLFCHQSPAECTADPTAATVMMDDRRTNELRIVNRTINQRIRPRNDAGLDAWSLAPAYGDCEDYAVTKRHELIKRGWPASALRLAVALTSWGEGHLVLVARTSQGDLVLDSMSPQVRPWQETNLRWQLIQSGQDPKKWYRL